MTVFLGCLKTAFAFEVPELIAPINDYANMIDQETEQKLSISLSQIREAGGAQIAVLTLNELGENTIEQTSIEVVDNWQLGDRDRDDGVLITIVLASREMRIEVGQGLEGNIPDAIAKRIISEYMAPLFKEGSFSKGITIGVFEVAKRANPELDVTSYFDPQKHQKITQHDPSNFYAPSWLKNVLVGILLVFLLFTKIGRKILFFFLLSWLNNRRYHSPSTTGGFSNRVGTGGFGGSGGFDGGGFDGGGGGFSGGGASGEW